MSPKCTIRRVPTHRIVDNGSSRVRTGIPACTSSRAPTRDPTTNAAPRDPGVRRDGDYSCTCTLLDPDGVELWTIDVGGIDEVQALTLALAVVGERLAVESPPFAFLGDDDPGFPGHGVPWDHQRDLA